MNLPTPSPAAAPDPSVVVAIPHYRPTLEASERAALARCVAILDRYPKVLVVPVSLDTSAICRDFPQLGVERFDDGFFAGIDGYNRLMLDDAFYARFGGFAFLLIHQLDALVFRDALEEWCLRGFDYVGAPWLRDGFRGPLDRARVLLKRRLYQHLDRKERDGVALHTAQINFSVGNGGLSLRRIVALREALRRRAGPAEAYRRRPDPTYNEDAFFGIEANRSGRILRIPGFEEAAAFSWESAPRFAQQLTRGVLPFGCHGWNKFHRDFWRPVFAAQGLDVDALLGGTPA